MAPTKEKEESIPAASRNTIREEFEPSIVTFGTSNYVRKLLAERHYVYARLYNQGGSVITQSNAADTERGDQYSSVIGSSIHNDLIELQQVMATLPKADQDALLAWADGLDSQEAAQFLGIKSGRLKVTSSEELQKRRSEAVRQRRSRAVKKLTSELNDDSGRERTGTDGDGASGSGSEAPEHEPEEIGRD